MQETGRQLPAPRGQLLHAEQAPSEQSLCNQSARLHQGPQEAVEKFPALAQVAWAVGKGWDRRETVHLLGHCPLSLGAVVHFLPRRPGAFNRKCSAAEVLPASADKS